MGWTGIHATEYRNGRINRKAQMDKEMSTGNYEVLHSTTRGKIYYAGVKHPDGYVFGLVAITSIDTRDWFDFSYKLMDESMLPYYFDCPSTILKLLSPTDDENSLTWRGMCKTRTRSLGSLPVGTTIRFKSPWETRSGKQVGDIVELTKTQRNRFYYARTGKTRTSTQWTDGHYRWTTRMIPSDYEIVEV